ncbi:acetyl esterase/lipase [Lipingzhangella halophila]|uniref:Acetyl esterase/lipase n=1 Tax=Lipingzhangella halophila TaxID=1783352 RepID=A0A7W7RNR4_9ACTN|nr:alpha/beta hydrolase [Lipingzhangella halophila]MBB4935346.1 acetyl esterase/lipase [Lipingzhangella halophila]
MSHETSVPGARAVPVGPPVPFDPDVAAVLAALRDSVPRTTLDALPALREQGSEMAQLVTADQLRRAGAFEVQERTVPGPAGAPDVPLLVCVPTGTTGPLPVLFYIHGGGMVAGDNRVGLPELQELTGYEAAIVSVDYRLAPEHPHPAPVEDCYAGLVWTAENTADLGIDPDRILVAGSSAGGGLAAATALLARDRGGPALVGQMLMCPMLDDRNDTPSSVQMAGLGIWDRGENEVGWTALLGAACGGPDVSPYAAPARATDLSNLPPAYIDVGSAETFRDEDVAYATRIWQAGGIAELHVWPGGCHSFEAVAPHAAISVASQRARTAWLRRTLSY